MRLHKFNESIFDVIDQPEQAYWLGFLMADGSVSYKHGLRLGLKDFDRIDAFKLFMGGINTPIKDIYSKNSHTRTIAFYSKKLLNIIERYGLIPNKTYRTQINNIPKQFLNSFILGYFDGDGCIFVADKSKKTNKCMVSIASSSIKILEQIQQILKDNNVINKNKNYMKKIINKNCYSLYIGNRPEIIKFYYYLYKDSKTFLLRKKEKFIELQKRQYKAKKTKYIGVSKISDRIRPNQTKRYVARFNKKYIGSFFTEEEAAIAYNKKLIELNYPNERLNKIDNVYQGDNATLPQSELPVQTYKNPD